jgi:hypothetical protein
MMRGYQRLCSLCLTHVEADRDTTLDTEKLALDSLGHRDQYAFKNGIRADSIIIT